jgi:hypothetical protein
MSGRERDSAGCDAIVKQVRYMKKIYGAERGINGERCGIVK